MLVRLHPFADFLFGGSLFSGLEILPPCIEVAALPTFCLHEYERSFRMSCTDYVYEPVEVLVNGLCGRI
jgi:hypothetical protein